MAFELKKIQERLDSVYLYHNAVKDTQKDCPVTIAMRNDVNAGLLQSKKINEVGQKVSLDLVWHSPECGEVETGCVTDPCATGDAPSTHGKQTIDIECSADNTFSKAFTFNYSDFEEATALMDTLPDLAAPLNETSVNGTSVEDKLLSLISSIDIAAENALAKSLVSAVSQTTYGFSPKEIPSLPNLATDFGKAVKTYGTGTALSSELFTSVRKSAKIAKYMNNPIILGGFPVEDYLALSGGLCCASNGVNLGEIIELNKTPIIQSDALIDAMIAEYTTAGWDYMTMPAFLSYDRGSMQILNYYTFAGKFGMKNGQTTKMQILSPFTRRPMGLVIKMSDCGESITVRVQTTEKYLYKPETQCEDTAAYGVNGLQQFVIKNS